MPNSTTAAAPTNGLVVLFADPMTYTGNVDVPAVDTELAMIVLSRHSVNDNRPPATSAEEINGKVICRNARPGGAPRSAAASSSDSSRPARRARTIKVTSADVYNDWPTHRRRMPSLTGPRPWLKGPPTRTNQPSRAMASMISGVTRMRERMNMNGLFQAPSRLARATPARPPSTTAINVPPMAAVKELRNASPRPLSLNMSAYPWVRCPTTMTPSTTPTGIDQVRMALIPDTRPINQATATMAANTRIAFHVRCTSNNLPHHFVE